MNLEVRKYAIRLRQEPPIPCDFKVGDRVTFTNEFGVSFPGRVIIGFAADDSFNGRFIHFTGIDHPGAYWFPCKPDELTKD